MTLIKLLEWHLSRGGIYYAGISRKMCRRKYLIDLDKGRIVMARQLGQSISKVARLAGCSYLPKVVQGKKTGEPASWSWVHKAQWCTWKTHKEATLAQISEQLVAGQDRKVSERIAVCCVWGGVDTDLSTPRPDHEGSTVRALHLNLRLKLDVRELENCGGRGGCGCRVNRKTVALWAHWAPLVLHCLWSARLRHLFWTYTLRPGTGQCGVGLCAVPCNERYHTLKNYNCVT